MSNAIEYIVNAYVRLNNDKALEDLLAHRHNLLGELEQISGVDSQLVLTQIREEIAMIERGLECLGDRAAPGQNSEGARLLRLTVSEVPSRTDDSAKQMPAPAPAMVTGQPTRREAEPELTPSEPKPASTRINVLRLTISEKSTETSVLPSPAGAISGVEPSSFPPCAPQSNDITARTDKRSDKETPYSTPDPFGHGLE